MFYRFPVVYQVFKNIRYLSSYDIIYLFSFTHSKFSKKREKTKITKFTLYNFNNLQFGDDRRGRSY